MNKLVKIPASGPRKQAATLELGDTIVSPRHMSGRVTRIVRMDDEPRIHFTTHAALVNVETGRIVREVRSKIALRSEQFVRVSVAS